MNTHMLQAKSKGKKAAWLGGVILAALVLVKPVEGAVVTLNPTADTLVAKSTSSDSATYTNYGGLNLLGASIYPDNAGSRGEYSLLRFNVSSIVPSGATINSVTLTLTAAFSYTYTNNETLNFWQLTPGNAAWVQGTSAGQTTTGATGAYLNQTSYTSTSVNSGTNWASGGIFNASAGDLGALQGSQALSSVAADTTYTFNLSTSLITDWMTNSADESAGLVFHMTNNVVGPTASTFLYFYSMDSGKSASMLPQLTVDYTAVPEPGVTGLLGVGVLALVGLRARRIVARRSPAVL